MRVTRRLVAQALQKTSEVRKSRRDESIQSRSGRRIDGVASIGCFRRSLDVCSTALERPSSPANSNMTEQFDPLGGLFTKFGGATEVDCRTEKLIEHDASPESPEEEGNEDEHGNRDHPTMVAARANALSQMLATQDDAHPLPSSIVRAGSQLSGWLDGYFTDPVCGLKGIMVVTLFEAMDSVLLDAVEDGGVAWDASGFADMAVVRALTEGGLMDGLGWDSEDDGPNGNVGNDGNEVSELSELDDSLREEYPAVYDDAYDAADGTGFPSVSFGPQAGGGFGAAGGGLEEATCEKDEMAVLPALGVGTRSTQHTEPRERSSPADLSAPSAPTELLGVVRNGIDGVVPTPVGEATEAAMGELLRLGDIFATERSASDRALRAAADDVAQRLRTGDLKDGDGEGGDDGKCDSEIVPNSEDEEDIAAIAEVEKVPRGSKPSARSAENPQQYHTKEHDEEGFAVPMAKGVKRKGIDAKETTPSSTKDNNPESDPYLLSGLHATADCLAMVQPTAREEYTTEPWMSIPKLKTVCRDELCVGSKRKGVAKAAKNAKKATKNEKQLAGGGKVVPSATRVLQAAKKKVDPSKRRGARRTTGRGRDNDEDKAFDMHETEAQDGSMSEYSDADCPDEDAEDDADESFEVEKDDDGEVQVLNRPHRMIATCPPESQASAGTSPVEVAEKINNKRKSRRLAKDHDSAGKAEAPQRKEKKLRRSTRHMKVGAQADEHPNDNTEDMPIGEYVKNQKKVGCSKCRYKGCKKCRGYTKAELRRWQEREGLIPLPQAAKPAITRTAGALDGIAFMISRDGTAIGTKAQQELSRTIKSMGGRVLESLNDLLKIAQPSARATHADTVLVTNVATSRTLKCIGARVVGMPMITSKWIADCQQKKRLGGFTARSANVLIGKGGIRPCGPLLNQRRVYALIQRPSTHVQDINALVKLLGGVPVRGFDHKTDLVLYDGSTTSPKLKQEINRIKREARTLRKLAYPLSWLTDAIAGDETDCIVKELERVLGPTEQADKHEEPPATEAKKSSPQTKIASRPNNMPKKNLANIVEETEGGRSDDLMAIIHHQQAGEEREHRLDLHKNQGRHQQQQRQRECQLNRRSGHVPRLPTGIRPIRESLGNNRDTPVTNNTEDHFLGPIAHPFHGVSSMMDIECTWKPIDEPLANGSLPEGMRPTSIRKYITTVVSRDDEKLSVGDFVELLPGPGARQPKVAQVLALWKQVGRPTESCLFGRFLRFYRFEETSLNRIGLKSQDNQSRVYKTAHIEENVPLAAVLNKCYVEVMSGLDAPTEMQTQQMSDKDALLCSATYDFETGALAPIE